MTSSPSPKLVALLYVLALAVATALLCTFWWHQGRSVALPEVLADGHKLQCVSYSPFDKEQSPLQPQFVIKPERVDADLALLAKYFSCVRTYSTLGLEQLPLVARKYGLKMLMGAWVGSDPVSTRQEIEQLVASANQYPDVVQAVIVGNEALLRKDIAAPKLAALISEVKGRVQQPVTYADVWEFWLQHPQIAPTVDFITIHLLPYWEDEPTGIADDAAVNHVAAVHDDFVRRFAPKAILIGETGWPSHGRQRETAVPSRIDEARFMRGFVALAENNGWQYNLIEAFDQPWKRANEGAVGGYWGLFDADRQDKGVLAGPVSNLPDWPFWLNLSLAMAAPLLLVFGWPKERTAALTMPPLALLAGTCAALWLLLGVRDNRDTGEWVWTWAMLALNLIALLHAALALNGGAGWRQKLSAGHRRFGYLGLLVTGFAGALLMAELVLDARYRQFPSYILLVPGLVYLRWPVAAPRRETLLLAGVIAAGIPFQLYQETLANRQALGWALASALLVAALLVSALRSSRTSRNAPINADTTAGVTV